MVWPSLETMTRRLITGKLLGFPTQLANVPVDGRGNRNLHFEGAGNGPVVIKLDR